MSSYNPIITNIKNNDQVKASVVNVPVNQLAERTDYLKAVLDNVTASEFNFLSNMYVSAVAEVGNAVYWDADNKRFGRTLAGWDDNLSPYGSLLPSQSSYMAGILVSKHTGDTGAVIISGYIADFQNIEALFGEASPEAGIYYVSADVPGQLTPIAPPMTIPAVMYDGMGNILFLPTGSIVSQHDHHEYDLLSSMWLPATDAYFPNMEIPADAMWGYDVDSAPAELNSLFTLYTGTGTFVLWESGTVLNETYIEFTRENVWIKSVDAPEEKIVAHIAYPNSHGPSIIRAATTDTPAYLKLVDVNGLLTVTRKPIETSAVDNSSYIVVKDIADNVMSKGPVVTKITPGPGITLLSEDLDGHGSCVVGLYSETDRIVDADIINLNNAIQRTDGGLVYSVFPADRDSSMTLVANAGRWEGTDRRLKVKLWMRGPLTGNPTTPSFSLEVFVFPAASINGTPVPTVFNTMIPAGSVPTDPSEYYLCEADLGASLSIPSGAQIQYNIEPESQPDQDYLILRQGITTYVPTP